MRATEDEGEYFYGTVEELMQNVSATSRSAVGNLAIMSTEGEYLGFVDLHTGEVFRLNQVPEATNTEGRRSL